MEDTMPGSNEPKKINLEDLTVPGVQKTEPATLEVPVPPSFPGTKMPENLIANLEAAVPNQSQSKFRKILVPVIASVLVLAAGAGAGAYFFIFNGTTDEEIHASPDTSGTSELSDVSKDLQEKLAPADEISNPPTIENPFADTTVADTATDDAAVTDDAADTTTDTSVQPAKRVKRAQ